MPDDAQFCDICGSKLSDYTKKVAKLQQKKVKTRKSSFGLFKLILFFVIIGGIYYYGKDIFGKIVQGIKVPEIISDIVSGNNGGGNTQTQGVSFSDFDFYEDIMYAGLPSGIEYPDLVYGQGEWKYEIRIRYDSADGYMYDEIGTADLSLSSDYKTTTVRLYPKYANDGSQTTTVNSGKYQPFEGGRDETNAIKMIGNNAVLYIQYYYAYEGREYMLGSMWFSEDDSAVFLMTRGQN